MEVNQNRRVLRSTSQFIASDSINQQNKLSENNLIGNNDINNDENSQENAANSIIIDLCDDIEIPSVKSVKNTQSCIKRSKPLQKIDVASLHNPSSNFSVEEPPVSSFLFKSTQFVKPASPSIASFPSRVCPPSSPPDYSELICRSQEAQRIHKFIEDNLATCVSASLYICGHPGTGKTFVVSSVLSRLRKEKHASSSTSSSSLSATFTAFTSIQLNCCSFLSKSVSSIYRCFCDELNSAGIKEPSSRKTASSSLSTSKTKDALHKFLALIRGRSLVLVLDEIDALRGTTNNSVLHEMFSLPNQVARDSCLLLIGMSNTLNLIETSLYRMITKSDDQRVSNAPECVVFAQYTADQMQQIMTHKLSGSENAASDLQAIEFCAKKVAMTKGGDLRRAMSIYKTAASLASCERAAITVEQQQEEEMQQQQQQQERKEDNKDEMGEEKEKQPNEESQQNDATPQMDIFDWAARLFHAKIDAIASSQSPRNSTTAIAGDFSGSNSTSQLVSSAHSTPPRCNNNSEETSTKKTVGTPSSLLTNSPKITHISKAMSFYQNSTLFNNSSMISKLVNATSNPSSKFEAIPKHQKFVLIAGVKIIREMQQQKQVQQQKRGASLLTLGTLFSFYQKMTTRHRIPGAVKDIAEFSNLCELLSCMGYLHMSSSTSSNYRQLAARKVSLLIDEEEFCEEMKSQDEMFQRILNQ